MKTLGLCGAVRVITVEYGRKRKKEEKRKKKEEGKTGKIAENGMKLYY